MSRLPLLSPVEVAAPVTLPVPGRNGKYTGHRGNTGVACPPALLMAVGTQPADCDTCPLLQPLLFSSTAVAS